MRGPCTKREPLQVIAVWGNIGTSKADLYCNGLLLALGHATLQQQHLGRKSAKPYISAQFQIHGADLRIGTTFQAVPFAWPGVEGVVGQRHDRGSEL